MKMKKNLFIMCLCVFSQYSTSFAGNHTLNHKDSLETASALTLLNQAKLKLMSESGQIQRKGRALSSEEIKRAEVLSSSLKNLETLIKNLESVVLAKTKMETKTHPASHFEKIK